MPNPSKQNRRTDMPDCVWHSARPQNFLLETPLVAPRKGALQKLIRRMRMSPAQRTADIASSPDRVVMKDHIAPEAARRGGNILFVGVRAYTVEYPSQFEAFGGVCWTMDIDPSAAVFGVNGRHRTGCITKVDALFPGIEFTTIVLSGVLGFGVNRFSHQLRALETCASALEPGGMLVLGWNDRRVHSSLLEEATSRWFDFRTFGSLPPRIWMKQHDHNFAFLERRKDES